MWPVCTMTRLIASKKLVQTIYFQEMAEFAQCCFIRHCLRHEVDAREFPHGVAVVDGILGCRVEQVEPNLKQIHPQHLLNPHEWRPRFPLG